MPGEMIRQLPSPATQFLLLQLVDQVQHIEEPRLFVVADALLGDSDSSQMGLAGAGAPTMRTLV